MTALASSTLPRPIVEGSIDAFDVRTPSRHTANEAAPGSVVDVRGWMVDADHRPVERCAIRFGAREVAVVLDRVRSDVTRALRRDNGEKPTGFEMAITVPDIAPGVYELDLIGIAADGSRHRTRQRRRIEIHVPPTDTRCEIHVAGEENVRFYVSDTQPATTLGRGPHTLRDEFSMRVFGMLDHEAALILAFEGGSGAPMQWHFRTDAYGSFDEKLWIGDVPRGLYDVTLAMLHDERAIAVATTTVEVAGPHYLPVQGLTTYITPPDAEIVALHDASVQPASQHVERLSWSVIEGRPIAIRGYCLDPVTHEPPSVVFAQVGAWSAIPLTAGMPDPRPAERHSSALCGFGGIIDTARFPPGIHRLRITALGAVGNGYYLVADRDIHIIARATNG